MAQASRYLNGSTISQEMIIHTSEKVNKDTDVEIIETIRENSVGYVKTLEQLTNFTRDDGMQVFIFLKEIERKKWWDNRFPIFLVIWLLFKLTVGWQVFYELFKRYEDLFSEKNE